MSTQTDIKPNRIDRQTGLLRIAGLSTACIFGKDTLDAPALWQQFGAIAPDIPAANGNIAYGLCIDINGGEGIEYVCGIETLKNVQEAELPDEVVIKELPAFNYAVFEHEGHVSDIRQTCDAIFEQWLPKSKFQKPKKADFFFERYGERFDPQKGKGDIEIWIPVEE